MNPSDAYDREAWDRDMNGAGLHDRWPTKPRVGDTDDLGYIGWMIATRLREIGDRHPDWWRGHKILHALTHWLDEADDWLALVGEPYAIQPEEEDYESDPGTDEWRWEKL